MLIYVDTWLMTHCCTLLCCCIWHALYLTCCPYCTLHVCMLLLHFACLVSCIFALLACMPILHTQAHMLRIALHWHACFTPWSSHDRGWKPIGLFTCIAFHLISKRTLDSLGHHVWKCAIGGLRIENHIPLSHAYDKGCDWCIHCLKCIATSSSVLCCCQLQVSAGRIGRPAVLGADRQNMFGREHNMWPVTILHGRWPIPSAGGAPQHAEKQPWDLCSLQRSRIVKAEAVCAWQWHPSGLEHASHWILFPRLLLLKLD